VYNIEFDEKSRLLVSRGSGFWDLDEVTRFKHELTDILTRLNADGRPFAMLYDNRAQPTQSMEVMQAFATMSDAEIMKPTGRVAVLVGGALNKLQAERVANNSLIRVFRDEAEARQWLAEADMTVSK